MKRCKGFEPCPQSRMPPPHPPVPLQSAGGERPPKWQSRRPTAQAAAGQVLTQPPEAQPSLRSATDRFDDSGLGEGDDDEDLLLGGGLDALSLAAAAAGGGGASQQLTKQG